MSQTEHSDPKGETGGHENETHAPIQTPPASVARIPRLRDAMNDARQSHADRMDSIMGVRAAEVTRLELLRDALKDVIEEAAAHWDSMHFDIVPGDPPRFWIDMLGYVAMGRDARTYRLIEDLRSGRRVLFESADVTEMAAHVTEYIAHRLLERERSIEEMRLAGRTSGNAGSKTGASRWDLFAAFVLGALTGAVAILAYAFFASPPA